MTDRIQQAIAKARRDWGEYILPANAAAINVVEAAGDAGHGPWASHDLPHCPLCYAVADFADAVLGDKQP